MMGSRFVMAVFGRPFWMAASTCFHSASRGPAMVFKVKEFTTRKATTKSVRFILCPVQADFPYIRRQRMVCAPGWANARGFSAAVHQPRARPSRRALPPCIRAPLPSASIHFQPLPRVAHHLADEADMATQAVEMGGKGGWHLHPVDGCLDLVQPLEQLLPLPGVRFPEQHPFQRQIGRAHV